MISQERITHEVVSLDRCSEEGLDVPTLAKRRDVDVDGLTYVAMQRALRMVMLSKGTDPRAMKMLSGLTLVKLNPESQMLQLRMAGIWMEAFLVGVAAAAQEKPDAQATT